MVCCVEVSVLGGWFFFVCVALEAAAMEDDEEVSEPLQGLSFPAGPSLARYFGSFQERKRGERERETFDMDRGRYFPSSSEHIGRLPGSAALA